MSIGNGSLPEGTVAHKKLGPFPEIWADYQHPMKTQQACAEDPIALPEHPGPANSINKPL
jgi:hypothetical protein